MKKDKSKGMSFLINESNSKLLVEARSKCGYNMSFLVNEALRRYLPKLGFNVRKAK